MSRAAARARKLAKKALAEGFLRAFIVRCQALYRKLAPDYYRANPSKRRPCHTCAMNPSTNNWKGADSTALGLMQAIQGEKKLFICHEPLDVGDDGEWIYDFQKATPCAGFMVLMSNPASARCEVVRAAMDVRPEGRA